MITDSQIHVWEDDRPDRPWPKPLRNEPQLPPTASLPKRRSPP